MIDPRLYLVFDPVHGTAHPGDLVRAAVAGGVTAVQVRSPGAPTRALLAATLAVRDALAGTGVGVTVDDRVDVALAAGVDGVHLGQDDLPAQDARRLAGARPEPFSIGWSVTGPRHVAAARGLPAGTVDLLGAGPVHTTATKPDAGEGIGVAALADLVAHATVPTVAIGGITAARAAAVLATGVAGLAVSSAIADAADPAEAARVLRRAVDRVRGAPSGVPEGDTVFLAGKRLDDALAGGLLRRGELRHPRLIEHDLAGLTVLGVASVGKHLFTRFDDGRSLHSHFRMDGTWHLYRPGRPWRGADHQIRAILATDDRVAVGFRLHDLELLPTDRESDLVGHLGPDLLGERWDADPDGCAAEVERLLVADPDRELGAVLLDQRVACGVGNIYKTEVCFLIGVSPWITVGELSERQVHDAVAWSRKLLLRNAWRPEQSTTGDLGEGAQHWVFERGGRGCRRCRDVVVTARQDDGGADREDRIAYFCPTCQPGPHPELPPRTRRGRRPQQQSGRRSRYG